jgi:hypothetical protein
MRWLKWIYFVGVLTPALAAPALAQSPRPQNTQAQSTQPAGAQADNMALVRDKVRADKKLLVAENMRMTETEAKAFWPVYDAFQADLEKIANRAIKLVEYYAANYRTMTDTAATRMIDEHLALERDRAALLQSYRPRFSNVLPPIKVARYYQIENKVRAVVGWELAKGIPMM